MPEVALDPHLIALPVEVSDNSLDLYIGSILDWGALTEVPSLTPLLSANSVSAAISDNRYPLYDVLVRELRQAGVTAFDAQTLHTQVTRFASQVQPFEDFLGVADLAWGAFNWPLAVGEVSELTEALKRTGALVALGQHLRESFHAMLITTGAASGTEAPINVTDLLVEFVAGTADGHYPQIECTIATAATARDYLMSLVPGSFLRENHACDVEFAIGLAVFQRPGASGMSLAEVMRHVVLGSEFVQSIAGHRFGQQLGQLDRIVSACADAILGENLAKTRQLRNGVGAEEPQQTRGVDRAWRRDVDYEYRLHYWEKPGQIVELGAVVVHQDFHIPR
jgi:hypothetical protein